MSQIPLSKLKEIILDEYRQLTEGVELFTKDNIKKYEKNIIKIFNKVIPYADGIGIGVSGESIIGKFSLDKKNTWPNGYIENSRCGMFTLHNDGELRIEILSWGTYNQRKKVPKFRKSTVKSVEQAVAKSLKYLKLLTNKKYSLDVLPEGKRAGTETGQAAPPKTSKEKKAVKLYGAYIEYKMNSGNSEYGYADQRNQLALKMLKDKFKVPSNLKSKLKDKKYHDKFTDYKSIVWEGKLTEGFDLKKLEDAIKMFQKKIKKQGNVTNARDEEHLKKLIKVYKEMGGRKIKEATFGGKKLKIPQPKDFKGDMDKYLAALNKHMKDVEKALKRQKKEGKINERMDRKKAAIILKQIGGNRFIAMTGAKGFAFSDKYMSFKIGRNSKGINFVRIGHNAKDLYDMEFGFVSTRGIKVKKKVKDVYADMLGQIFKKHTGMNVSL